MTKSILLCAGTALALSLAACKPAAPPATDNSAAAAEASASEIAAVRQMEAAFMAAITAKNVVEVMPNYAPDAVMVLPGQAPMKGTQAITADYEKFAADPAATFAATSEMVEVAASGDLAVSQGTYRIRYTNPATKKVDSGTGYYVLVYAKQVDGSWKIIRDVNAPIPETA